jgi:hypothetical protein
MIVLVLPYMTNSSLPLKQNNISIKMNYWLRRNTTKQQQKTNKIIKKQKS